MQVDSTTMEIQMEFHKKSRDVPNDLAIPSLGIHQEETIFKEIYALSCLFTAFFLIAQI